MSAIRMGLIGLLAMAIRPVGADGPKPDDDLKRGRQRRMDFMKAKLGEFALRTVGPPPVSVVLADEPALRWTNPVRGVLGDGATFFWSEGGRPVAVATISIRTEGKVFREFALLGDRPIETKRGGRVVWSPRQNALAFRPLADAPAPARSPTQRLTQLRAMVRRFRVDILKGNRVECRLLSQPLLRYAAPDSDVVDGAVFAFAEATDPEGLLILEDRRDDANPDGRWFFSFARMSSPQTEFRLGDALLWTGPPYWTNPRSREDPYSEAYLGLFEVEKE